MSSGPHSARRGPRLQAHGCIDIFSARQAFVHDAVNFRQKRELYSVNEEARSFPAGHADVVNRREKFASPFNEALRREIGIDQFDGANHMGGRYIMNAENTLSLLNIPAKIAQQERRRIGRQNDVGPAEPIERSKQLLLRRKHFLDDFVHKKRALQCRLKLLHADDVIEDLADRMLCIGKGFGDGQRAAAVGVQHRCMGIVERNVVTVPPVERSNDRPHKAGADNCYTI